MDVGHVGKMSEWAIVWIQHQSDDHGGPHNSIVAVSYYSRRVLVSVGGHAGSLSQSLSADIGFISHAVQGNSPQTGCTSITVTGGGLGNLAYSQMSRRANSACESSDWVSTSSLQCKVSKSFGRSFTVVITAGVKSGSLSKAFSTDIHHVFLSGIENGVLFEGDGDGPSYRRNQAVYGTLLITLLGSGFGPLENTQIGRIGGTNCEETTWTSDSSVSCKITTKFGTTLGALSLIHI